MSDDRKLTGGSQREMPGTDEDRKALKLAETTDVSERQARELIKKHGKDSPKIEEEAKNFKAEG